MDKWGRHNQWLKETSVVEDKLRNNIGQYLHIGLTGVDLDGRFTPAQLREIANVVEERINAKEN